MSEQTYVETGEVQDVEQVWPTSWISVEDKLPKDERYVLTVQRDGVRRAVLQGWYMQGRWYVPRWTARFGEVTHWMAIPELPEEDA